MPTTARRRPRPVGRVYPRSAHGRRRRHGPGRHHPGRVPLRRPPHGRRSTRAGNIDLDATRRGPGPVPRHRPTHGRSPTTSAEDATLKANDHRPAGRLQGRAGGERHRHHRRAARRRQPGPDPGQGEPTSATSSPTASCFAANRTAAADGRAVANVAFSNGGGIRTSIAGPGDRSTRSRRSTCCRSTTSSSRCRTSRREAQGR